MSYQYRWASKRTAVVTAVSIESDAQIVSWFRSEALSFIFLESRYSSTSYGLNSPFSQIIIYHFINKINYQKVQEKPVAQFAQNNIKDKSHDANYHLKDNVKDHTNRIFE